jgi:hypothetical protein
VTKNFFFFFFFFSISRKFTEGDKQNADEGISFFLAQKTHVPQGVDCKFLELYGLQLTQLKHIKIAN